MAASRFDPAANLYTDAEKLDASAPASSTIIKTMIVQSSYKEGYTEGPRYAYQYTYDASGRLVNLDCWGYLYKYLNRPDSLSYANFVHRVATLAYGDSGVLSGLQVADYNQQGKPVSTLTFPVEKEGKNLVVYGKPQWYPNPSADQPILKITPTGKLAHLPRPWNGYPNVQFAYQELSYDEVGNLKGILLNHVGYNPGSEMVSQQTSLLTQIEHSRSVRKPFGLDPAYGAAHFLVRGGLDFATWTWLDVSPKMVLSSTGSRFSV